MGYSKRCTSLGMWGMVDNGRLTGVLWMKLPTWAEEKVFSWGVAIAASGGKIVLFSFDGF